MFKPVDKTPSQLVALMQAKELAQAELAAATQKLEAQVAKDKEKDKGKDPANKDMEEIPPQESQDLEETPPQESPRGAPAKGKGKLRSSPTRVKCGRAVARPNPIGPRPLTRRARALQLVSQ
jgi:hypothetical protein